MTFDLKTQIDLANAVSLAALKAGQEIGQREAARTVMEAESLRILEAERMARDPICTIDDHYPLYGKHRVSECAERKGQAAARDTPAPALAPVERVPAPAAALSALERFGLACLDESVHSYGDLDGGWIQDKAEALGLIVREQDGLFRYSAAVEAIVEAQKAAV